MTNSCATRSLRQCRVEWCAGQAGGLLAPRFAPLAHRVFGAASNQQRGPAFAGPWRVPHGTGHAYARARNLPRVLVQPPRRKRTTAELVESLYTHCYERFATVSLTRVRWPRREECKQKKFKPLRHICAFGAARTAVRAGDGARISSSNLHDQSMVGSDVPSLLSAASTGSKRAPRHDERGA